MEFETVCIHAGQTPDAATGAVMTPIYQSATYEQGGVGKPAAMIFAHRATRRALRLKRAWQNWREVNSGWRLLRAWRQRIPSCVCWRPVTTSWLGMMCMAAHSACLTECSVPMDWTFRT